MSRLLDLPVVDHRSGRQIARVERCCLSNDGQQLFGIVVRRLGPGRRRGFAEFGSILLIGDVSLQVSALCRVPKPYKESKAMPRVYTTSGEILGWMTDALLDESDGRIRALELSRGYFDDLRLGRSWIRDFSLRPFGFIAAFPTPDRPADPTAGRGK